MWSRIFFRKCPCCGEEVVIDVMTTSVGTGVQDIVCRKPTTCNICGKDFESADALANHKQAEHRLRLPLFRIICECGFTTEGLDAAQYHQTKFRHNARIEEITQST